MHKSATKCNEKIGKWCKNKHGASKIIDTFETYHLAAQRSAIYQQNLRRYHSRRVRKRSFKEGGLVLRLKQQKSHKLSPPWEGPFVISKALLNGSYYLVDICELDKRPSKKRKRRDPDDIFDETDRPWNIAQLRPFYT
jgi:hypothetical protein